MDEEEIISYHYLPVYNCNGQNATFLTYNGYIAVKNQSRKFGIIDYNGKEVLSFEYDYIVIYNRGALVKKDGKCDFIDISLL